VIESVTERVGVCGVCGILFIIMVLLNHSKYQLASKNITMKPNTLKLMAKCCIGLYVHEEFFAVGARYWIPKLEVSANCAIRRLWKSNMV